MKTEKTLKILKLMGTLQAQAKRAQKLQGGGPKKPSKPLTPDKENELKTAFELFDTDKSGFIDSKELQGVMSVLGVEVDDTELKNLVVQMDTTGDGQIEFAEFAEAMGGDDEPEPPEQVAATIFAMVDRDGSGKITHSELRSALLGLNVGLTEDDVTAILDLMDQGNDGAITKKEFAEAIAVMGTFS